MLRDRGPHVFLEESVDSFDQFSARSPISRLFIRISPARFERFTIPHEGGYALTGSSIAFARSPERMCTMRRSSLPLPSTERRGSRVFATSAHPFHSWTTTTWSEAKIGRAHV